MRRSESVRHSSRAPPVGKDGCIVKGIGGIALVALLAGSSVAAAQPTALSKDQIREFLLTAAVIGGEQTGKGTTQPWRLTLSNGTLTHDAHFQPVDRNEGPRRVEDRLERNFVDSFRYNIAAYRLAELVGLGDMMPVTVERTWDGRTGSLSWWLEDVMFDEQTRLETRSWPADMGRWSAQMARMLLFAELVQDTDRNQGNIVYTRDWTLYMIDFTRAFRTNRDLQRPDELTRCDRALLARLRTLSKAELEQRTAPYLSSREMDAVLDRRDAIVDHVSRLIADKGENRVLYE